jgi:excisionase family DNA binding protein
VQLLLSVNETAARLSIGRTKLYQLVARGELQLVKIGSKSLITHASLQAFVAKIVGNDGDAR